MVGWQGRRGWRGWRGSSLCSAAAPPPVACAGDTSRSGSSQAQQHIKLWCHEVSRRRFAGSADLSPRVNVCTASTGS